MVRLCRNSDTSQMYFVPMYLFVRRDSVPSLTGAYHDRVRLSATRGPFGHRAGGGGGRTST